MDSQNYISLKTYENEGHYRTFLKTKKENIFAFNKRGGNLVLSLELLNAINLNLIPFVEDSKVGFINKMAEIKISPTYDEVKGAFFKSDNYVAVRKGKFWSAIDSTGEELMPFDNSFIFPSPDSSLVTCKNCSGWFVTNLEAGSVIVKSGTYELIEGFRYGYARVKNNDKWGIINTMGKLVLGTEYESIYSWYEWNEPTTKVKKHIDDKEVFIKLIDLI